MANIKTFTAANFSLTGSDKGGQAFSQAGRRLGPLYNEAAQFMRESGKLAADNKAQLWPFDILELYQKNAAKQLGTGFKVQSGGRGGGSNDPISDFSFERFPDLAAENAAASAALDGATQVSRGAGVLGRALADGGQAMSGRQPLPPVGSPARERMMREAMAYGERLTGGGGPTMTLENGNLVTAQADASAFAKYQSARDARVDGWTSDAVNTRDYWTKFYGGDQYQTDQSQGNPVVYGGEKYGPQSPSFNTPDTSGNFFSGMASSFAGATTGGETDPGASGGF